jgi:alanyl-tRNA synthetase
MGLERIAAVMQGVPDNYDTDTFKALIATPLKSSPGTKAVGEQKASHRVIADHLRSTSFLLADGVMPSNEGRGYVLAPDHAPGDAPRPYCWARKSR